MAKAEPALVAAQDALNTLNKNNLTELKSFGSPPGAVVSVTAAVMVLLAPSGKISKDRSWKSCKVMMAKVQLNVITLLIKVNEERAASGHLDNRCARAGLLALVVFASLLCIFQ